MPGTKHDEVRDAQIRAAAAVRALAGALVERVNDADTLNDSAAVVEELTHRLEAGEVRDLRETYREWMASGHRAEDAIIERAAGGPANATAVPIVFDSSGDALIADLMIPAVFAGWPGCAHGGVAAAILDDVLGQVATGAAGAAATTNLEIEFRRPTPIGRPLQVEARLVSRQGRLLHIEGVIRDGATELVTASGRWIMLDGAGLTV